MALKTITTTTNKSFVYDDSSLIKKHNILNCNFLMLRCIKMIQLKTDNSGKETYNYQYPNMIFHNLNMCNEDDIMSDSVASDIEKDIYQKVLLSQSLGKELNKYLRDHHLIEMSYSAIE